MGLLYQFPIDAEEKEYYAKYDHGVELRSYGLPLIFWGYALAILLALGFMFLASIAPINKMLEMEWWGDRLIAYFLLTMFISGPIIIFSFFFYEKVLMLTHHQLHVSHSIFKFPIRSKIYQLKVPYQYEISVEMDSPNMAKLQNEEGSRGFQNKGYFRLKAQLENGKFINIDRSSSKVDLAKMAQLLFGK